jgi:hypothetical protein
MGFSIVNIELELFDPNNSSFLLQCNSTNHEDLIQLGNISRNITEHFLIYMNLLNNSSLSTLIYQHGSKQKKLFDTYNYLSGVLFSIYDKVQTTFNPYGLEAFLIDISDEMQLLFDIDETITSIIDDQVEIILSLSDKIWDDWTKERDWSFMD